MTNFTFPAPIRAVVIGASGGIGHAFCEQLLAHDATEALFSCARTTCDLGEYIPLDYADEESIRSAAEHIKAAGGVNLILVATGLLHDTEGLAPEKSLRDLSHAGFEKNFLANTIGPALVAKHFLPLLPKDAPGYFGALSARVGSISDNQLGGWYAYRSAKAALNMVIRCAAIETARRYKHAIIVGLHPGTVDTELSQPFQSQVKDSALFTPAYSSERLLTVLSERTPEDSGKCFAWDGTQIAA